MKSRAVRLTLFLLFVMAIGATAYLFWLGETRIQGEGEAARAYDARVVAIIRDFDRLRASQQAYVAAGQGDQFWTAQVTSTLAGLQDSIQRLHAASVSPDAQATADNAAAILQDFEQMDRRAREYARSGQRLLASDLIFADGMALSSAGAEAVQRAGLAERQVHDATLDGVRGRQLYAMGAAAAAALLVALLLLPTPRQPESVTLRPDEGYAAYAAYAEPGIANGGDGVEMGAALDDSWSRAATTPAPPAAASVEMASVASLCTDLARLADTRSLPALLERAAEALDASGIVLWIADPDGRELSPIVTHGYAPTMVTRLGTILRDAENATASALRTSLLQTVKADAVSDGAIAAPLVSPAGCVGVMAAEVRHGGEQDPAKLAAATIIAAQLSALVGPPSAKARSEATG